LSAHFAKRTPVGVEGVYWSDYVFAAKTCDCRLIAGTRHQERSSFGMCRRRALRREWCQVAAAVSDKAKQDHSLLLGRSAIEDCSCRLIPSPDDYDLCPNDVFRST